MVRVRSFARALFTSSLAVAASGASVACGTADDGGMDTDVTSDGNSSTNGSSSNQSSDSVAPVGPTGGTSSNTVSPTTSTGNQTSTVPASTGPSGNTSDADTTTTGSGAPNETTTNPVAPGSDTTDPSLSNDTSSDATSDTTDDTTDPPGDGAGFYVADGKLFDVNGVEFIMRGVNYPYTWYVSENTQQRFADIASTGANVVRVVMSTGDFGSITGEDPTDDWTRTDGQEVTSIISWAKANKLIAMLEVHDATGYGDTEFAGNAVHPNFALDYWTSPDVAAAIKGQEAFVLLNIANESFGNDLSQEWEEFYEAAVGELRAAGLHHTLVVDAPFWGQDWGNCMRDGSTTNPRQMSCDANRIFDADPDANTMFSVHMYDVYGDASTVTDYFDKFLTRGLPLIVGEFAADHGAGKNVDEATIMRISEERKVGYIGWSWSGNSGDLSSLDMTVGFNLSNLTPWGDTLINGANGLKETGVPCTCFE